MSESYGLTKDGRAAKAYTITNKQGASVTISDFGGIITRILVPDKDGQLKDVTLGYDSASDYENGGGFMGALIGRYANRIAKGHFTLNGKEYQVAINNGANHLHGGNVGFDKYIWQVEEIPQGLKLSMESPDMDEQYPGNMKVEVIYTFDDDNCLTINYRAVSDKDTVCNLTNHAYFNLDGHDSGSIEGHVLKLYASVFTPTDEGSIPIGKFEDVEDTPFDFRMAKSIGQDINMDCQQLKWAGGYDHNYVLDKASGEMGMVAEVHSINSGIRMSVETTQPGVQFYSGNSIDDNTKGKDGATYQKRDGFCLETQNFPDAVNHDNFPSAILRAGEIYEKVTKYRFDIWEM